MFCCLFLYLLKTKNISSVSSLPQMRLAGGILKNNKEKSSWQLQYRNCSSSLRQCPGPMHPVMCAKHLTCVTGLTPLAISPDEGALDKGRHQEPPTPPS